MLVGGADGGQVINVTWEEARRYVAWLTRITGKPYRLLSEAEWEYAARAGTQTVYPWGDDIGNRNANCKGCGSQWDGRATAPVGQFDPNAFGLFDMVGNVWQWLEDCAHESYDGAPSDGTAWTTAGECNSRVVRGGSYLYEPDTSDRLAAFGQARQSERSNQHSGREDAHTSG